MLTNEAKVNWGPLAEVPEISVNRFGSLDPSHVDWTITKAFFLTHYDDEITEDILSNQFLDKLSESSNHCRLYLHKLAFDYFKYLTTTDQIENGAEIYSLLDYLRDKRRIIFMETDQPIRLYFRTPEHEERTVDATAISSGSNAGCVMYLFEFSGETEKRILYTGSCRVTIKDLLENNSLHHPDGSVKKLSKLYLDTTFCLENVKEFPSRRHVTQEIIDVIRKSSDNNPTMRFDICTPLRVHHLSLLLDLAYYLKEEIHVPPNLISFLAEIPVFRGRVYSEHRMPDRLHYDCGYSCDNELCAVGLEWGVDFDVMTIDLGCKFSNPYETAKFVSPRQDEEQWCKNKKAVYPGDSDFLRGIYSSHLSRYEMGRMINFFGLNVYDDVVPLQKSPQMRDHEIQLLLYTASMDGMEEPEHLIGEPDSSAYDFTNFKHIDEIVVHFMRSMLRQFGKYTE